MIFFIQNKKLLTKKTFKNFQG